VLGLGQATEGFDGVDVAAEEALDLGVHHLEESREGGREGGTDEKEGGREGGRGE
jgi:hypothetical protein